MNVVQKLSRPRVEVRMSAADLRGLVLEIVKNSLGEIAGREVDPAAVMIDVFANEGAVVRPDHCLDPGAAYATIEPSCDTERVVVVFGVRWLEG